MLLTQTDLRQTGAVLMNVDGERMVFPLFSQSFGSEISDLVEMTNGRVEKVILSSLLESEALVKKIKQYKKEHNGSLSKELMDDIRFGFLNPDKYRVKGYC